MMVGLTVISFVTSALISGEILVSHDVVFAVNRAITEAPVFDQENVRDKLREANLAIQDSVSPDDWPCCTRIQASKFRDFGRADADELERGDDGYYTISGRAEAYGLIGQGAAFPDEQGFYYLTGFIFDFFSTPDDQRMGTIIGAAIGDINEPMAEGQLGVILPINGANQYTPYAHEFGHIVDLHHRNDNPDNIMHRYSDRDPRELDEGECNRLVHAFAPEYSNYITTNTVGSCGLDGGVGNDSGGGGGCSISAPKHARPDDTEWVFWLMFFLPLLGVARQVQLRKK